MLLEEFYLRNKKRNGNPLYLSRIIQLAKKNNEIYNKELLAIVKALTK